MLGRNLPGGGRTHEHEVRLVLDDPPRGGGHLPVTRKPPEQDMSIEEDAQPISPSSRSLPRGGGRENTPAQRCGLSMRRTCGAPAGGREERASQPARSPAQSLFPPLSAR